MKNLTSLLVVLAGLSSAAAQAQTKFQTQTGTISFFSSTPLEDISAKSTQARAVVDAAAGHVAFTVPIRSFVFPHGLMQDHFNENYMESDKYPRATFAGAVLGWNAATLAAAGPHPVQVEGNLTIHGVTRRVKVPGTLEQQNGRLLLNAKFPVMPADYGIEVPSLIREHIAKTVDVTVAAVCAAAP